MLDVDRLIDCVIEDDCRNVMRAIPDKSIDLIVTDPPYLKAYKTNYRKDRQHDFCSEIENDRYEENKQLIQHYVAECYRIMKDDTAIYMFCSWDHVDFFKKLLSVFFTVRNCIIWVKNNHTAGDLTCQFGLQYEMILLATKGRSQIRGKRLTDVWDNRRVYHARAFHQNEKPLPIIETCIAKHSDEGDLVFDGFAGSGTTGVACQALGRRYILVEKNPRYVQIALNRIMDESKQLNMFERE